MRLIDRIVQCRAPFVIENNTTGRRTRLSGAADEAAELERCPVRYVLDDSLTRLCIDLAYSSGTSVLDCIDLIRVPARRVWVEWNESPWREALRGNGFACGDAGEPMVGHRGIFVRSTADGLEGRMRPFWSVGNGEWGVHAGAAHAHFDLQAAAGGGFGKDGGNGAAAESGRPAILRVFDDGIDPGSLLTRCFHFDFEESWARYYAEANLSDFEFRAVQRHCIGAIAIAVPMLLAFFLLLAARGGLPQRAVELGPLNRARARKGRPPLLEHVEVGSPIQPDYTSSCIGRAAGARRRPRLHHVRGHLVRRNNQIFWRVPHLRGRASAGVVQSRTVVWRFDAGCGPA